MFTSDGRVSEMGAHFPACSCEDTPEEGWAQKLAVVELNEGGEIQYYPVLVCYGCEDLRPWEGDADEFNIILQWLGEALDGRLNMEDVSVKSAAWYFNQRGHGINGVSE